MLKPGMEVGRSTGSAKSLNGASLTESQLIKNLSAMDLRYMEGAGYLTYREF